MEILSSPFMIFTQERRREVLAQAGGSHNLSFQELNQLNMETGRIWQDNSTDKSIYYFMSNAISDIINGTFNPATYVPTPTTPAPVLAGQAGTPPGTSTIYIPHIGNFNVAGTIIITMALCVSLN